MNATTKKLNEKVEAYGAKGMKSTPWRKVFKNLASLDRWVEKTGAEVYGVRDYGDRFARGMATSVRHKTAFGITPLMPHTV